MNIEHQFIESELAKKVLAEFEDGLDTNVEDQLANQYDADAMEARLRLDANNRAARLIKKNKRELKRLVNHAEKCLYSNNFDGYSYAIRKLRDFYRQPYNDALIKSMWASSRAALFDIVKNAKETLK